MRSHKLFAGALFFGAIVIGSFSFALAQTSNFSLPQGGSYVIQGRNGTSFPASYNYSPTLVGPTLEIMNAVTGSPDTLGFQLGNNYKSIIIHRRAFKGPVARWDISDPFNPKNPQKFDGMGPMPVGDGPIGWRAWGHESNMGQVLYAENSEGDGRLHVDYANYFTSHLDAIVATVDSIANRINIAGKYSDRYLREEGVTDSSRAGVKGPGIVVNTPADKYFAYFSNRTNTRIFDITDTAWSQSLLRENRDCYVDDGCIEHSSTVSWGGVSDWEMIQYPGRNKQYLLSVTPSSGKSVVRVGEVDAETGKILRPKSQTISAGTSNFSRLYGIGFSNPQAAYVNGKIYVFALESIDGSYISNTIKGTIGIYLLNENQLTLSKTGSVKVETTLSGGFASGFFTVLNSADGTTYPLLEIFSAGGTVQGCAIGQCFFPNYQDEFRFYSLRDKLNVNSEFNSPEFVIGAVPHLEPLIEGEVVQNQYPAANNGFLKKENGKTYAYVYRTVGVARGTRVFEDFPYRYGALPPVTENRTISYDHHNGQRSYKGDIGVRVDKIDVTSIAPSSGYTPPTTTPPGGTPPGGTPPGGGGIGTGGECAAKYANNPSLRSLCEQIEALKAQACRINPNLSFCAKP